MSAAEKEAFPEPPSRDRWLRTIDSLFSDVERWAGEWLVAGDSSPFAAVRVERTEKEVTDELAGDTYVAPVLRITNIRPRELKRAHEEHLVLEPVTFNSVTGKGRVDFYAWPTLYRVRLLQELGTGLWTVKTDSGLNWPLPWGEKTFVQLAEGLMGA
jgi:hypothetical protein